MINNTLKINLTKTTIFLSVILVFALIFTFPTKVEAIKFNPFNPIDPFCLFSCDDDEPDQIQNITNSNNTNSFNTTNNTQNNNNTGPVVNDTTPVYSYNPPVYNPPVYSSPLYASCYSTPTSAGVGSTISWRASISGGNGSYYITWTGTDSLYGNGTSISRSYSSAGTKNASITVTSGNQTTSYNCSNSVTIYDYNYDYNYNYNYNNQYQYNYPTYTPVYVTCRANVTFAPAGTTVVWSAYASGGRGYYTYTWSGTDGLYGSQSTVNTSYYTPGVKSASVTAYSDGYPTTAQCSNTVTVGIPTPIVAPTYTYPNSYVSKTSAPVKKVTTIQADKVIVKGQQVIVKQDAPAPVAPVVNTNATPNNNLSAGSLFSLQNVPWGWVALLVILVLFGLVLYLLFNKKKI